MAVQYRGGGTSGNNGAATVNSQAVTLPAGWVPGDLLFAVLRVSTTTAAVFTQSGGTGAWVIDLQGVNITAQMAWMLARRVMTAGDTDPTFTWTGTAASTAWSCGGFYSDAGRALVVDRYASGDPVQNGTAATSVTPTAATADSGSASVIFTVARASASATTAVHAYTPPSGWTWAADGDGSFFASGSAARFAGHAYQSGVAGTVTPGPQTLTDAASDNFWFDVIHALVTETAGPWALVQSLRGGSDSSRKDPLSISAAFGADVTFGNRVFVYTSTTNTTDCDAPTDSQLNTYTKLAGSTAAGASTLGAIWTAVASGTGPLTVTVTAPASTFCELGWTAEEYSGLDVSAGAGCLDQSASGTGNVSSTADADSGTTAATTSAGQLALSMVQDWGGSVTWTVASGTGFTKNPAASLDDDPRAGIAVANGLSGFGTAENCVWHPDGTVSDSALVAVIKLVTVLDPLITITQTGSTSNGMLARMVVLTGAARTVAQTGGTGTQSGAAAHQAAVTTTQAGSIVYGALANGTQTSYTAAAGTTLSDNFADAVNGNQYGSCRTTAATVTPGTVTVGASAPAALGSAALAEILPFTPGGTITADASSPPVSTTTGATTVQVNVIPPGGSLLVLMVVSDGGTGSVVGVTVSGGGLTWVPLAEGHASGQMYAGVWIADIAGSGGSLTAARPGKSRLQHHHGSRRQQQMLAFPADTSASTYTCFTNADTTGWTDNNFGGTDSLGLFFKVTQTAWCTGMRIWKATASTTGPWGIRLYQPTSASTGTLLASGTITDTGVAGTWQPGNLPAATQLTAGTWYLACVDRNAFATRVTGYWASGGAGFGGRTNGPLYVPDVPNSPYGGQDAFDTAAGQYPATPQTTGTNYGLDVTITTIQPPAVLTLDAASPACKIDGAADAATKTLDSNSFTPPGDSVIIITYETGAASGGVAYDTTGAYPTITDSLASHLTWNQFASVVDNTATPNPHRITTWWAWAGAASPGAMTVSVTDHATSGLISSGGTVAVKIWDNTRTASPVGALSAVSASASVTTLSVALTPTATGSAVFLAATSDGTANSAPGGGMVVTDTSNAHYIQEWTGLLTTSLAPVTLTQTTSPAAEWQYVAYEVLPADAGPLPGAATPATAIREHAGHRKGRRHGGQRQQVQDTFGVTAPVTQPGTETSPPVAVQDGANW